MVVPHTKEEQALRQAGHRHVAGADEVGKGAWAGPLVAAAVILPTEFAVAGVRDSKQLSPRQRQALFVRITKRAVSWAVHVVPNSVIDRRGIKHANVQALQQALRKLHIQPDAALVDAIRVKHGKKPVKAIIKGDEKVLSIAAASIVAKVVRDTLMSGFERQYPGYGFARHKGYGTAEHELRLKDLGPSDIHRKSFAPVKRVGKKQTSRKVKP